MTQERNDLQSRLSAFLVGQYPVANRDKLLSADIQCDPRTARNYFAGFWPGARAWRAIVRRFGADVIAAVFEPEIDETVARLRSELRAAEKIVDDHKARLRSVAGPGAGLASDDGADQ